MSLLPAVIRALVSPLGPHLKSDIATDLYSGSTSIAIMDESDHRISFNCLNKSVSSLLAVIGALRSPLGPYAESDLATNLYFGSTPIAIMNESNRRISFNRLSKSTISLSVAIEASGSPLGLHSERDLATYLYFDSTPIAIKDESNHQINFKQFQEIYNVAARCNQGMGLSFGNPSRNRSCCRCIL
jgi:hypothetical protein